MPKALLLIDEDVLNKAVRFYTSGRTLKTIRLELGISATEPTIKKLIQQYQQFLIISQNKNTDQQVIDIAYKSFFPEWIKEQIGNPKKQPDEYKYVGVFPMGEWRKR